MINSKNVDVFKFAFFITNFNTEVGFWFFVFCMCRNAHAMTSILK